MHPLAPSSGEQDDGNAVDDDFRSVLVSASLVKRIADQEKTIAKLEAERDAALKLLGTGGRH